jgi:hypothetical protein
LHQRTFAASPGVDFGTLSAAAFVATLLCGRARVPADDKPTLRTYIAGMRVLLAFLAVLGLVLSPVTASSAVRQCAEQDLAMTTMADAHGTTPMAAMDCCPQVKPAAHQAPAKPAPANHDRNSCANACATICLAVAALPASTSVHTVVPLTAQFALGLSASLTTHDPPRLERPPRSIA